MSYFMLPKVYGRLMPEHIDLSISNNSISSPFINQSLANYLNISRKAIEQYIETWDNMKKITNPYEYINIYANEQFRNLPVSRNYFKMIEIINVFKMFPLDIQSLYKCFYFTKDQSTYIQAVTHFLHDSNHNYSNTPFIDLHQILSSIDFIVGDMIELEDNNETNLIIAQVLNSILIQKKGGTFILKVFDLFTRVKVDILYILSLCYNEVYIYKPNSSRYTNSEKFIICKDFKGLTYSTVFTELFNTIINKLDSTIHVNGLYSRRINSNYLYILTEANSILGQQQLEYINNTITLIEQGKKKEKIEALKKHHVTKSIEWCKKYNIYQPQINKLSSFIT